MDWISDPQIWIGLATLTSLEIVLGIDNVIFISILAGRLPEGQRDKARVIGLGLAVISRILLLLSLSWLVGLTDPLFAVFGHAFSGRDLILGGGGLFLIAKSTFEMHHALEGESDHSAAPQKQVTMRWVLFQIMLLDVVFSLDSVITAVGMVDHLGIMVAAVIIAVAVMIVFAGPVSRFVEKNPTVKMLALSFLLLIGVTLIAESMHLHIPKGYTYFAMAFALFVELLNLRIRRNQRNPIHLRRPPMPADRLQQG